MFRAVLLLCLAFLFEVSHAQSSNTEDKQTINNTNKASKIIDQITGVYKKRFKNGDVFGENFTSEDILEIVKINDNTIYFVISLTFFNNHACLLHGTAMYTKDNLFSYRDDNRCNLDIMINEKDISFFDNDEHCRNNYCGFRGEFGTSFKKSMRRPIKYMKILKNSDEYKASIEELKK